MFKEHLQNSSNQASKGGASYFLLRQAAQYLQPLEQQLDQKIDKRLVRTFYDLFISILIFRHTKMGLLLSELGAYICGPARALSASVIYCVVKNGRIKLLPIIFSSEQAGEFIN